MQAIRPRPRRLGAFSYFLLFCQSICVLRSQPEVLNYKVEWRLIQAGIARITFDKIANASNGRLDIQSQGLVSKLFRVNDIYEVSWRPGYCAQSAHMISEEGSRRREANILFATPANTTQYVEKDLVKNTTTQKSVSVPPCVEDILGGLQKLRALKLTPGTSTQIPISDGKKFVEVRVEVQEKEEIKTVWGTHKAVRLEAFLFNGAMYDRSARCFVWITDDEKRTPVMFQVRMRFHIGNITLTLDK
jgi:hypothetical protein